MTTTLRQWLEAEPFSLGLSSGFFGFYAHCGMVCALEAAGLRPKRLCGSSAGALVAALWGAGLPGETIRAELTTLERRDFWDPAPGLGLLAGRLFAQRLARLLPAARFEDCPTPVAVSVFDIRSRSTRVIDEGPLAPAVQASCTVPLLFHPRVIDGRPLLDGGLLDRPGLTALPKDDRLLYHHLASRSPWRTKRAVAIPQRDNTATLVIGGLPRLGPFRLHRASQAIDVAEEATRQALDLAVEGGVVRA
ncbi:MAG: patatin-like phospholipase family protein [Deltaproteobacteria bacterium]|nr:patatin-like phospholipase family protein [Deltaproteobacteria bacterium]